MGLKRCLKCHGAGKFRAPGMIMKNCILCNTTGWIDAPDVATTPVKGVQPRKLTSPDDSSDDAPLPLPKKKGRPAKQTTFDNMR